MYTYNDQCLSFRILNMTYFWKLLLSKCYFVCYHDIIVFSTHCIQMSFVFASVKLSTVIYIYRKIDIIVTKLYAMYENLSES